MAGTGFTTPVTTFQSENTKGFEGICEYLPKRKMPESLKIQALTAYENF